MHSFASPARTPIEERRALRDYWLWFLVLGIVMVALGTVSITWACLVTLTVAATWLFGFVLLAGGITEIINSFWAGRWSGTLLHLLIGVMYTIVGFIIIQQPETAAIELTLFIAFFLMFGGIFRVVFALSERFIGWPWVVLNGAVTLMCGLLIYKQWPASGLWVIGLFIGIELIFNGWAWIAMAIGLRQLPAEHPVAG